MGNEIIAGTLYIVATPIGNLGDISPRALSVLGGVDFIAAEDTRVTLKLLTHFDIRKSLVSYYENNKRERGPEIIARLKFGESCALVSDAGTPAVSDPGEDLVRLCAEEGITVCPIPGACAAVSALAVSGLFTGRFSFEGFLSNAKAEKRERLTEVSFDTRTLIFYEAPHHLKETLTAMLQYLGDRKITLARELTKINEEIIRTTISEALKIFKAREPRGEFVLVVEGAEKKKTEDEFWIDMSVKEHFSYYTSEMGLERMDAIKAVAKDRGIAKNAVYKELLDDK